MNLTLEEANKEIPCSECLHWSRHECLDSKGNKIARKESPAVEPFWYYELCKKTGGCLKTLTTMQINASSLSKRNEERSVG